MRDERRDYRVVFVSEPVSWTEVPADARGARPPARRWHRGLSEILWKHRRMIGQRPRTAGSGWSACRTMWLFELLAPVLELAGVVIVPLGLAPGRRDRSRYAVDVRAFAYGYAIFVSLAALCRRGVLVPPVPALAGPGDRRRACVLENIGYRQLTAWWRLQGWWAALRGTRQEWGTMTREGFGEWQRGRRRCQP